MAKKKAETAGERLKDAVNALYVLDPAEELLLERAAGLANALERLDQEVAELSSLTTTGSKGQRVAEPLLREQREHAARLTSLLEVLRLPDRDELQGRAPSSLSAQRAAQIRWSRQKGA